MEENQPKSMKNRTYREQKHTEEFILGFFQRYYKKQIQNDNETNEPEDKDLKNAVSHFLLKDLHADFLYSNIKSTGPFGRVFDNGQPWIIYWITHAIEVLDCEGMELKDPKLIDSCVKLLKYCQAKQGGFGGGPFQLPHLAATYASILSMIVLGSEEGYKMVDREKMYKFLMSMRNPAVRGSFLIHEKGECDMRAGFIAMITADILNIMTDELKDGVGDYIASLQTYEGGIGSTPYEEAHGAYTFCGFAGLCCIGEAHKLDLNKLQYWITSRQLPEEGGFNGRTNKIVDACYTFWIGAIFHLINSVTGNTCHNNGKLVCDQMKVQMYALLCAQDHDEGGLRDKPGKYSDYYHSAYTLAGLNMCQRLIGTDEKVYFKGLEENRTKDIDPLYNVELSKLEKARNYFRSLPKIH